MKNPGRPLEIGAKYGCAEVYKIPTAALSTKPDVNFFYHTGKGLYHGKID